MNTAHPDIDQAATLWLATGNPDAHTNLWLALEAIAAHAIARMHPAWIRERLDPTDFVECGLRALTSWNPDKSPAHYFVRMPITRAVEKAAARAHRHGVPTDLENPAGRPAAAAGIADDHDDSDERLAAIVAAAGCAPTAIALVTRTGELARDLPHPEALAAAAHELGIQLDHADRIHRQTLTALRSAAGITPQLSLLTGLSVAGTEDLTTTRDNDVAAAVTPAISSADGEQLAMFTAA